MVIKKESYYYNGKKIYKKSEEWMELCTLGEFATEIKSTISDESKVVFEK